MTLASAPPVRLHVPGRTLVLVAGLPGAGKSTLLATLPPEDSTVVLDSERTRALLVRRLPAGTPYPLYRWAVHLLHRLSVVLAALAGPDTVVVHLPSTTGGTRSAIRRLARLGGRAAHLVWVHAEPADALAGQHVRGRVVRGRAFAGHAARAGDVAATLRSDGPPAGWASARVLDRSCAHRGLRMAK
ncbi:AAA family ATPase [Pseudonocardia sp. KRD291]|uniref:AAA family ATPase n=1 Tax=Pseudonocardia sp. KRD291 TaxID=2792007 RepID=UPI001C4A51EF|nr:AAA family ATPase [Pseudonocardia sp. KRD291]MBW0106408.1 AAA family ATPase [Pseudonocardia sp. KRD291]